MITKDDYNIVNKDGTSVNPQLEDKMKNIVQEFINHPKFEEFNQKMFLDCVCYGESICHEDDLEKLYKEMTCYYNDGLYCKKGINRKEHTLSKTITIEEDVYKWIIPYSREPKDYDFYLSGDTWEIPLDELTNRELIKVYQSL